MGMRRFMVVVEKAEGNFSAYSPELPGCVATGESERETLDNMVEAIRFHLEGCEGEKDIHSESNIVSTQYVYA